MVSKKQIETIINSIINPNPVEADKCSTGSSSGKKPKKPKSKTPKQLFEEFNRKDFKEEEYENEREAHPKGIDLDWESPQGKLQGIQSDLQFNKKYTSSEKDVAYEWSTSLFVGLNSYLFGKPDFEGRQWKGDDIYYMDSGHRYSLKDLSERLSSVIDNSPRLQENTVTYRYGPVDELMNMEVGEGGTFKGFQSTSFNYTVANKALQKQVGVWFKENRGMVRFHNMKGTKGMVVDYSVGCKDWQSEWLIDKGQKFVLVGKGMAEYDGKEVMTYDVLVY